MDVKRMVFIVMAVFFVGIVQGQILPNKRDTAKKAPIRHIRVSTSFTSEDSALFKPNRFSQPDTSIAAMHELRNTEKWGNFFKELSNFSSPAYNRIYDPFCATGFQTGFNHLDLYRYRREDVAFFDTRTPYTQLKYVQGAGQLQYFEAKHFQSLNSNFSIGVDYQSRRSDGFYLNEITKNSNLALSSRYFSKNHHYQLLASFIWNGNNHDENGGIVNPDIFGQITEAQRLTSRVFLEGKSANQDFKERAFQLRQLYYLGGNETVIGLDSTSYERVIPRIYFTHKLTLQSQKFAFTSDTATFFKQNVDSFSRIQENFSFTEIRNEAGFGIFLNKQEILKGDTNQTAANYPEQVLYAGLEHTLSSVKFVDLALISKQSFEKQRFNNLKLFANLSKSLNKQTHFKGHFQYIMLGSQFSDFQYRFTVKQQLFKHLYLVPVLRGQARSAFYIQQQYQGHFGEWDNDFKKMISNELSATLQYKERHKLQFSAIRTDQYIYMDPTLRFRQATTGILVLQARLTQEMRKGIFGFGHDIVYQKTPDSSLIRVPELTVRLKYFIEREVFNKAGQLQLGFVMNYTSSYFANAFMPGISQFYVQNARESKAYPYVDVYFSFRIKRWVGLLKMDHVSQGIFGYQYETMPNEMLWPRALRMGVSWRFYN